MNYDYPKERQEAINAGNQALISLKQAKACLDSARNWGIWDMIGGGFFSSLLKRSKINSAKEQINRARQDLQRFAKELDDVRITGNIEVEINDFIGFADLLWDNLLFDWMIQDRINTARRQIEDAIQQIQHILNRI